MKRSCGSLIFRSKKCVVNPRCLGDYPASCGVCISTPADFIVAKLTTITRSINVAIALRIFENAMDYVGVNFEGVVSSKHGDCDPSHPIDDGLDKTFASWGADAYDGFVNFVAESRSQSNAAIKAPRVVKCGLRPMLWK